MKKILSLLAVSLVVIAFTSCSDDTENPYEQNPTLKVVSSDVVFDAPASTGTVVVSSESGTLTATTSNSWATASVSGNTINVAVTENDNLEGRSSLLTIKNGIDSVNVTIQQLGKVFRLDVTSIMFDDAEGSQSYEITHNIDATLTSSADWFSATISGDELVVTATANSTGHMRNGYLYIQTGDTKDSIRVVQCEFDNDLAGKCYFGGYDTDGKDYYLNAELKDSTAGYFLKLTDYGFAIPIEYDESSASISISGGSPMGTYGSYYIGTCMWDINEGYLTWSSSVSMSGLFNYYESSSATAVSIEDNGSWSGYTCSAIRFEAFKSSTFTNSNRLGMLDAVIYPTIIKLDSSSAKGDIIAKAASLKLKK